MNEMFFTGQRVRLTENCGFVKGVEGIISYPPKTPILDHDFGGNYFREVDTLKGKELSFWVKFDMPQYDSDGDGPYREGKILTKYLEAV